MKILKYIIRIVLLSTMVFLGFTVALPQWFDLKNFMVDDYKKQKVQQAKEKTFNKNNRKTKTTQTPQSYVIKSSEDMRKERFFEAHLINHKELYLAQSKNSWRMKIILKNELKANTQIDINKQTAELWVKKLSPSKLYYPVKLSHFNGLILT